MSGTTKAENRQGSQKENLTFGKKCYYILKGLELTFFGEKNVAGEWVLTWLQMGIWQIWVTVHC